jgi:UV DNA damage endonuclease
MSAHDKKMMLPIESVKSDHPLGVTMLRNHIGYACINTTLTTQGVCSNRTLRLKTLQEKGYDYVAELILSNLDALQKILEWNAENGYRLYRMSSEMFPFHSHLEYGYKIEELPNSHLILEKLREIGRFAQATHQRLSYHPGPFNVLASSNPKVIEKTVNELNCHSHILNLMGFTPSYENKINIHVGGAYGDKQAALARFCANFALLDSHTQQRLTVENDDRANLYSVQELYDGVHLKIGIPIVFDYHHYKFNKGGQTEKEALLLALSTWPSDVTPVCHYSESKTLEQGEDKETPAHSQFIVGVFDTYQQTFDVVFEAKQKELAVESFFKANPEWTLLGKQNEGNLLKTTKVLKVEPF